MTETTSPSRPVHLVVGASGGIGSALCRRLAATDPAPRLALAARDGDRLEALAAELADAGADADDILCHPVDARDQDAVEGLFDAIDERFGRLDGLVHLPGSVMLKPAHLTTLEEWRDTLDLNLTSAFLVLRRGLKAMLKSGGSVVLVSTAAAREGLKNHEAIAAAKGGLQGLARSAAATYAGRGVRVNCVAPGLVATGLTERIVGNEKAAEASRSLHPLGRLGEPEDVAPAIAWLLGDDASWVTGQVIGIDGGLADLKTG